MSLAAAWILLALIWGTTWSAISIGLQTIPPVTFAGLRFVLGALLLGLTLPIRGIPLPHSRQEWRLLILTGLEIFALGFALQFWGMQYVPSGLSAVVFSAVPLFTMFIAHFKLHNEKITHRKIAGTVIAITGIAFIFSGQLRAESNIAAWGVAAFIVASIIYAHAQVTMKRAGTGIDPNVIATVQMASGGIVLVMLGLTVDGSPLTIEWNRSAVLALLYMAVIGSSLAMFLLYWLARRMEITKVMTVLLADPVIAVALGWIFLGEVLELNDVVGSLLAIAGLAVVLVGGKAELGDGEKKDGRNKAG
ncbi:MAG: EamA family transporter [Gemmatimonadetes bacterium]|nr:EamA family transporter [Gemmatimonadota bacterium]